MSAFYEGIIGEVYSAAIAGETFTEDEVFRAVVEEASGPSLELGSGTGRLMLRFLAQGHIVHGLEISDEMTRICLVDAARQGLAQPVVHRGTFAPLTPGIGEYGALYCPLNAFSFIISDDIAQDSLHSYAAALNPGGVLAIAGSAGQEGLTDQSTWVTRPDVMLADSIVATVKERRTLARRGQVMQVDRIVHLMGPDGQPSGTEVGQQYRRLRTMTELATMFDRAGFTDLRAYGADADYVLTGRIG